MGLHDLVALHGFQVDIEAPQAMKVLEHFLGGVAQRLAIVLLVAQGQERSPRRSMLQICTLGSRLPRLYWAASCSRMIR